MASAQVVETSVTNNSPSQDSNHPDDLFQSRYVTPEFKPFSYLASIDFFLTCLVTRPLLANSASAVNLTVQRCEQQSWKAEARDKLP